MPAGSIERGADPCGGKPAVDRLDALAGGPRNTIISENCRVAFDVAVGHQKTLRGIEIRGRNGNRLIELPGELLIGPDIRFDHARAHGGVGIEHIELEIDAAALREREPIGPAAEGAGGRDNAVALVDRDRRRRRFSLARQPAAVALRVRARCGDKRKRD